MKARGLICLLLVAAGGAAGYFLHAVQTSATLSLSAKALPGLDYFFSPKSFSEVENAKAMLDALSSRYLMESRSEFLASRREEKAPIPSSALDHDAGFRGVQELKRGIEEFHGTDQELVLVQELLWRLKAAGEYDEWIDVYLRALYEHPTHELVGRWADEALMLSGRIGRAAEVSKGLAFISMVPLKYSRNIQVEVASGKSGIAPEIVSTGQTVEFH